MTITTDIPRLNYSKPPPGYTIVGDADEPQVRSGLALSSRDSGWVWVQGSITNGAPRCIGTNSWAEALAATWADYKAHNDPPGFSRGGAALICWPGNGVLVMFARPRIQASRTAAWAWYDRRDALADSLSMVTMSSSAGVRTPFWPRILTWTDEQVAEVERWLRDNTAEMPEVLRG